MLMKAKMRGNRSWTEQYPYLVAAASAADCSDRFVLQYICECAPHETKRAMQTRIDSRRAEHLRQAWELADCASTFEPDSNSSSNRNNHNRSSGRGTNLVANVETSVNDKKCWNCGKTGHMERDYPERGGSNRAMFALAVGLTGNNVWVLVSGASRHLVRDANMLLDAVGCHEECKVADGQSLAVTKKGRVVLRAVVEGAEHNVVAHDVYSEKLTQNLLTYCKLEENGMALVYNKKHVSAGGNSGVFAALQKVKSESTSEYAVKCTLMELHERLGHLMDDPRSGVVLTDRKR
ncbi:hypothetical protein PC118_g6265 [Phytophthora cactorum]|uniref:CCHC-type domain-containing protein n=1 Tax=Phytophthora cactorum TaxID=29920 RepID=A0A8T1ELS6_9STRA|nr:hypothetical protein PC114_g1563 [Phytophthora cactorum]KAG2954678.1 hypothetical protein PC117_g1038 [Phytophthora cactorum]KAG2989265.1 hypothetical protein PC118_g6265 [Phytophthora cactorum]KAG3037298.1 hypothetical protein PC119_g3761 [Phytophthora cactorum]KAG3184128.1 hypothetical protein C6341_g5126 [Phytophthora cactorum]